MKGSRHQEFYSPVPDHNLFFMEKTIKNPTFFVDIDGTMVEYRKFSELSFTEPKPITEVINFINEHYDSGSVIIITTARPENLELFTKQELEKIGVKYHQLVMNCGRGSRVILNDLDPDKPEILRSVGINLKRNEGFRDVEIPSFIKPYESI